MKTEFEARILNISFDMVIAKLETVGAKRIGIFHQKRYTYDFVPRRKGNWVRLRSNGAIATLAIKEIKPQEIKEKTLDGTNELEVTVSDFEDTNLILEKLGYNAQSYQENFRMQYKLDNVEVDLEKWPMLPPFMEIEGISKEDILKTIKLLDINTDDITTIDIDTIYKENNIDLNAISSLKFSDEERLFIDQFK